MINLLANILGPVMRLCYHWTQNYGIAIIPVSYTHLDYGYLVKKVVFNIRIIPFVKILSALFVHAFFVIFILLLYILNNIFPSIYWLQIVYYSGYMIILCLGITYVTSALMIFFRDLSQIINVFLQDVYKRQALYALPLLWK